MTVSNNKPGLRGWLHQVFKPHTSNAKEFSDPSHRQSLNSYQSDATTATNGMTSWDKAEKPYHLVRSNSTSSISSRGSSPSRARRHRSSKRSTVHVQPPSNYIGASMNRPYDLTPTPTPPISSMSKSLPVPSPLSNSVDPDVFPFTPSPPTSSKWGERRRSVNLYVDTAGAVKIMQEKKAMREAAKAGKVAVAQPVQQPQQHQRHHHQPQSVAQPIQPVQQYYAQQPYPAAYAQPPVATYQPGRYGEVPMMVPQQGQYVGTRGHRADYARV
ncbi:hypothetical protein HK097_008820 [Rhizophlyctis rosea]|uniref:Uncharacterized protein n=1 Tax=Rhizophlyctis rosea TaxID=64517 RepID=A0AAD5X0V4_9FUNG|nr:hypothetical protein HK097_008820 [Rhizophlyctis rosea]